MTQHHTDPRSSASRSSLARDTAVSNDTARQATAPAACGCCSRRTVLRGSATAAALGGSALVLGGCTAELQEQESAQSHHAGGEYRDVLAADELPVGANAEVEVSGRSVLLHRSAQDTVLAYSAVCTHQGCAVGIVERDGGEVFSCPCHGSHFRPENGEPFGGPARQPLTDFETRIEGGRIAVRL
ncbi:MAG: Rieske (2Fe-2S) protein [Micrococcus sp.]|nr:Rieske (2Fe-2S) protein [Micrococcus sp.]